MTKSLTLPRLLIVAALVCFAFGLLPRANAAGGRRFPSRFPSSNSAAARQPATQSPAASGRQTYRRYSAAPAAAATQSPTRAAQPALAPSGSTATRRTGRSGYGSNAWRADRKVLGY